MSLPARKPEYPPDAQLQTGPSSPRGEEGPAAAPSADGPWLSVAAAAAALGRSVSTVRRQCQSGELVARREGGGWLVSARCRPALSIAAGIEPAVASAGSPLAGLSAGKRGGIASRLEVARAYEAALAANHSERGQKIPTTAFQAHWIAGWNHAHPDGKPLSRSTLCRWCAAVRAYGVVGLVDRRGGCRSRADCDGEAWKYYTGLYLSEARPTMKACWQITAAQASSEGWSWPSLDTVRRWTQKHLDPKLVALGRDPKRYRDRCLPYIERDAGLVHANELWVADHRQLDVLVPHYDPAARNRNRQWSWRRPWLTMFLDFRTWKPTGWRIEFDAPDGNRVMSVFVAGVEAHGQPRASYLDNGKDFRMYRFAGGRRKPSREGEEIACQAYVKPMLELMGVEPHFAIPYNAKAKTIEPFFRIVSESFDTTWDTYCGNKTDRRPERLKTLAVDRRAEEFYQRGLSIETVREAFDAWLTTDYELRECPVTASKPHSVIDAFRTLRPEGYIPQRPPAATLMLLLMPSRAVRVGPNGIHVAAFGRRYWSDLLEDRRCASGRDKARHVVYRYRPDDDSKIYVFDAATDKFLCLAEPYAGGGMHPLAPPGSPEADRLADAMALQRRTAKRDTARLKEARQVAGNVLLAAARRAGETLGLHAAEAPAPPPATIQIRPATSNLDQAAAAAEDHRRQAVATADAREQLRTFFHDRAATGTDDHTATNANGPGAGTPCPSALDLLTSAQEPDHAHRTAAEQDPPKDTA